MLSKRLTSERFPWWGGWTGQRRHEPGFRLNICDLIIGAFAVGVSALLYSLSIPVWWAPTYVFLSFFAFCNVLRIPHMYEVIWGACVLLAFAHSTRAMPDNPAPFVIAIGLLAQLCVSVHAYKAWRLNGVIRKEGRTAKRNARHNTF